MFYTFVFSFHFTEFLLFFFFLPSVVRKRLKSIFLFVNIQILSLKGTLFLLGLTPQSINKFGTYAVRAKEEAEAEKLISDAKLLAETGCFGIVLEKVPAQLAARVTSEVSVPTIGIGAGNGCDGQVLVVADMLGMTQGFSPRFLRRYANLNEVITDAVGHYVTDVKSGDFPNESESY